MNDSMTHSIRQSLAVNCWQFTSYFKTIHICILKKKEKKDRKERKKRKLLILNSIIYAVVILQRKCVHVIHGMLHLSCITFVFVKMHLNATSAASLYSAVGRSVLLILISFN